MRNYQEGNPFRALASIVPGVSSFPHRRELKEAALRDPYSPQADKYLNKLKAEYMILAWSGYFMAVAASLSWSHYHLTFNSIGGAADVALGLLGGTNLVVRPLHNLKQQGEIDQQRKQAPRE